MVYAKKAGEKESVADGIFEHYLPRFTGDILPKTDEGIAAAISDKIDTCNKLFQCRAYTFRFTRSLCT